MSGSDAKKLAILLLISVIAGGSVVYQIRNRRAPRPAAAAPASPQAAQGNAAPTPPDAGTDTTSPGEAVPQPELTESLTTVPPGIWGRGGRSNPFLSMQEVEEMNRPPVIEVRNETPAPTPPPDPSALPTYSVTAIIARNDRNLAIVGTRVLQEGDLLGHELVKEIKERAVVLEYEGRTRELALKRPQNDIRQIILPRRE